MMSIFVGIMMCALICMAMCQQLPKEAVSVDKEDSLTLPMSGNEDLILQDLHFSSDGEEAGASSDDEAGGI